MCKSGAISIYYKGNFKTITHMAKGNKLDVKSPLDMG